MKYRFHVLGATVTAAGSWCLSYLLFYWRRHQNIKQKILLCGQTIPLANNYRKTRTSHFSTTHKTQCNSRTKFSNTISFIKLFTVVVTAIDKPVSTGNKIKHSQTPHILPIIIDFTIVVVVAVVLWCELDLLSINLFKKLFPIVAATANNTSSTSQNYVTIVIVADNTA